MNKEVEPIESIQMNIYQRNTYRRKLAKSRQRSKRSREAASEGTTVLHMTTVLHVRPYGRFIEIQSNIRRKKVDRIKAPIFLEAILAIEIM